MIRFVKIYLCGAVLVSKFLKGEKGTGFRILVNK
jgi:hypothetical protein